MASKDKLKQLTTNLSHLLQSISNLAGLEVISSSYPQLLKVNTVQWKPKEAKKLVMSHHFTFDPSSSTPIKKISIAPSSEPDIAASVLSPSKSLRAIFRKDGDKTFLEIWGHSSLYRYLNVTDQHGGLYDDETTTLRAISWSKDENRILYLAETKKEKKPKYFEELKSDEDAKKVLENFDFVNDFGEMMTGNYNPSLYIYDIKLDALYQVRNTGDGLVPLQASFADQEGNSILFCGLKKNILKRGLLFCFNRETSLYYLGKAVLQRLTSINTEGKKKEEAEIKAEKEALDKEIAGNQPVKLVEDDISVFPILTEDFSKIAYFFSPLKHMHAFTVGLKVIQNYSTKPEISTVLDIVKEKNSNFAGIVGFHDEVRSANWLKGNRYFAIQTQIENAVGLYIVDTETKELKRIDTPKYKSEVWSLLTIEGSNIYAGISNIEGGSKFAIFEGFDSSKNSLGEAVKSARWSHYDFDFKHDKFYNQDEKLKQVLHLGEVEEQIFEVKGTQAVFLSLKNDPHGLSNKEKGLIVDLHGGPHATTTSAFMYLVHFLLQRGYNYLMVNYTGSLGFGQNYIDDLCGKIGSIDIEEVKAHIDNVIEKGLCHPEKLVIDGGSYSGYQVGVFLSKYPSLFRCAINGNPVLDGVFNKLATDITEWNDSAFLNREFHDQWSVEDVKKVVEMSPLYMKNEDIKTSILMLIGAKDQRVPPQQSVYYYKMMKKKGFDITMRSYPEAGHGIGRNPEYMMDAFLNKVVFLESKNPILPESFEKKIA